jgi:hypothetical protein
MWILRNTFGSVSARSLVSLTVQLLTARVYDVAVESALEPAKNLSRRLHNRILLKREDQQPVFSFKLRGAYNKMAHLPPEQLKKGVICASAGNHAQGVALGATSWAAGRDRDAGDHAARQGRRGARARRRSGAARRQLLRRLRPFAGAAAESRD